MDVKRKWKEFRLKLKILMWNKKYLPVYNSELTREEIINTNCYGYAFKIYLQVENYELFSNLGFSIGNHKRIMNIEKAIEYFKIDVRSMGFRIKETDASMPKIGFKVALFYIIDGDFHFMRLNEGNIWSEKLGYRGEVRTITNTKGKPILPEQVKYGDDDIKFVGYFWIW